MLTDIFADRYSSRKLWVQYGEAEFKLLTQCFRIVAEQLIPYWSDGKEIPAAKAKWSSLHDKLSMELGVDELSPKYYSYQTTWNGQPYMQSGFLTLDKVCKDFVCAKYNGVVLPDRFMKERISFIELAFRACEEDLTAVNLELSKKIEAAKLADLTVKPRGFRIPGSRAETVKAFNDSLNQSFRASVDELNERFRRADTPL